MELGHLEGETEEMADVCRGDYDDEGSSDMVIVVFLLTSMLQLFHAVSALV